MVERLTGGEADDFAAQLLKPMKEWLAKTGPVESFGLDEFIQRVSKRDLAASPQDYPVGGCAGPLAAASQAARKKRSNLVKPITGIAVTS